MDIKKRLREITAYFNRESIYKQLEAGKTFLLPHKPKLKFQLAIGGMSFYDGNQIVIGLPEYMIEKSYAEIYSALKAILGHECEHGNSSDLIVLTRHLQEESKYFFEKYSLNKSVSEKISHYIVNSVEDGRIEKLLVNRLKGYLKHIKYFRGMWWVNQPVKGENELNDFLFAICTKATMGLFPKDWENYYTNSRAEEEIEKILPLIIKAINSANQQACCNVCKDIRAEIEEYIIELLQDQQNMQSAENMNVEQDYDTNESSQGQPSPGNGVSTHFRPEKQSGKEEDKKDKKDEEKSSKASKSSKKKDEGDAGDEDSKEEKEQSQGNGTSSGSESEESENGNSSSGSTDSSEEGEEKKSTGKSGSKNKKDSDKSGEEGSEDGKSSSENGEDESEKEGSSKDGDSKEEGNEKSEGDNASNGEDSADEGDEESEGEGTSKGENSADEGEEESDGDKDSKDGDSADEGEKSDGEDASKDGNSDEGDESSKDEDSSDKGEDKSSKAEGGEDNFEDYVSDGEIVEQELDTVREEAIAETERALKNADIEQSEMEKEQAKEQSENASLTKEELAEISKEYKEDGIPSFSEIKPTHQVDAVLPTEIVEEGNNFRNAVKNILISKKQFNSRHRKRGRVDTGSLWRIATKDYNVFEKRGNPEDTDSVFYILKDGSGSMDERVDMYASKWFYASKASAVIEEGLKGIVPLKIATFTSSSSRNVHYVEKEFRGRHSGNCSWDFYQRFRPDNGNKDGHSIRIATKELLKRSERNKVLIILSDGLPSAYGTRQFGIMDVSNAVAEAKKLGVKVIAIAFGSKAHRNQSMSVYSTMYSNSILACEPADITHELIRVLKSTL